MSIEQTGLRIKAVAIDKPRQADADQAVTRARRQIDAAAHRGALETGTTVAEVALCYTGDLSSPGEKLYTLDYYLRLAERIVDAGAHVLAIKDMAGLLRAPRFFYSGKVMSMTGGHGDPSKLFARSPRLLAWTGPAPAQAATATSSHHTLAVEKDRATVPEALDVVMSAAHAGRHLATPAAG